MDGPDARTALAVEGRPIMAQELEALVKGGRLEIGTVLTRTHKGKVAKATVAEVDGAVGLQVGKRLFRTPSSAGRAVTGGACNGWTFWKLPSGDPLGSLRSHYLPAVRSAARGTLTLQGRDKFEAGR